MVNDFLRGASRGLLWFLVPWLLLTWQAWGSDLPRWVALLPTAAALLVAAVAGVVGVARARNSRLVASEFGWDYYPETPVSVDGLTLFPFDDARRNPGEGALGYWNGRPAARFVYGGRTIVHAVSLDSSLPALQILPRGVAAVVDAGGGSAQRFEVEWFDSAWRVVAASSEYAHAALIPPGIEALQELEDGRPIIGIEGGWLWAVDGRHGMSLEQTRRRFDALTGVAQHIPAFVYTHYGALGVDESSPFYRGVRRRNSWARMALLLGATVALAPVGLVLAIAARYSVSKGLADNRGTATAALVASTIGTALWTLWMLTAAGAIALGS